MKKKLFCCRVQCCIIGCANQAKHKAGIPFCSTYARIEQQGVRIAFTRIAFGLFSNISLTFRLQDIYRRRETGSICSTSHFRPVGKIVLYANSILRQRCVFVAESRQEFAESEHEWRLNRFEIIIMLNESCELVKL